MSKIVLKDLSIKYENDIGLDNLSLEINKDEFVCIVGKSGSGKTTLLKTIAGLIACQEGQIFIDDQDVTNLAAYSRDIAMVFQDFVLYPHMTVYENVYTPLKGYGLSREQRHELTIDVVKRFGLINYLNFKPRNLSEGQRQRVAICKALVRKPSIFLLDEPLGNLDYPNRIKIEKMLVKEHKENPGIYLYVTHDFDEVSALADRLIVMEKGKIVQDGKYQDISNFPSSLYVDQLLNYKKKNFLKLKGENISKYLDINVDKQKEYIVSFYKNNLQIGDKNKGLMVTIKRKAVFENHTFYVANYEEQFVEFYLKDSSLEKGDVVYLSIPKDDIRSYLE